MGDRRPYARGLDSEEERGFDYTDDELLLALDPPEHEWRIWSMYERDRHEALERDHEEWERREAEHQRELEEGPRVMTLEEARQSIAELRATWERERQQEQQSEPEPEPLTDEQVAALRALPDPQP